jgi:hypothetical protein
MKARLAREVTRLRVDVSRERSERMGASKKEEVVRVGKLNRREERQSTRGLVGGGGCDGSGERGGGGGRGWAPGGGREEERERKEGATAPCTLPSIKGVLCHGL